MTKVSDIVIRELSTHLRDYDSITKAMVSIQNRAKAMNPDVLLKEDDTFKLLISYKGRVGRKVIEKLEYFPVSEPRIHNRLVL